ncbi:hypothetical protein JHK87_001754 [Glycine soja]|nr:hypothetical protein JHK87_001754 [Glycine soja]
MSFVYSSYYCVTSMLKALVTIIVFLMIMCVQDGLSEEDYLGGEETIVRDYNWMNDSIPVYLHCQSKDDDLGQQVLVVGEHQEWSFKGKLFGTTLFWCTMDACNVHSSFEVYNAQTEETKCQTRCNRILNNNGGYFFNEFFGFWEKRLSWYIPKTPSF